MHLIKIFLTAVGIAAAMPQTVSAGDWPHWRGPNFDGSSPEKNLPTTFSKTEGVIWSVDLPGPAAATPIVLGDRVFISSTEQQKKTLLAICFDRKTGKKLWEHTVSEGFGQDNRSNYASPSPVTDGERVIFFYGNGELVSFDLAGKKQWGRNIQKDHGQFAFLWTFSTSPTIYDGKLYMQVLQRDVPVQGKGRKDGPIESYLLALDPKTGKDLWRQVRPSEAREESLEAFSTPIPAKLGGREEILIAGGDCISGHDPETGKEFWRWGTWNPQRITHWRLVPSPVAAGDVAIACGPKGEAIYAVKAGAKGSLEDESALAWKSQARTDISSDVSTPLYYKGRLYVMNSDKRTLSALDPKTGKVFWTGNLESKAKIEASPTGADDKIYVMNHRGDLFVTGTGDEFKLLHTTAMGEEGDKDLRSSVAVGSGNLFVRTGKKLYCIGPK